MASRGCTAAASVAPATYPTTCAACTVVALAAIATGSWSRVRSIGCSAERAACAGALPSVTRNITTSEAAAGMPGMTSSRTSSMRSRSQTTITRRYGYRSASAASSGPHTTHGR
jgi:hypothetical protein